MLFTILKIYYRLKFYILKPLLKNETWAIILYNSHFPKIVLELGGAKLGKKVRVGKWLTIHESRGNFKNLEIAANVFIGKHVMFDLSGKIIIKERVAIGMNVVIITHINFGDSILKQNYTTEISDVIIDEDAIINWGVIVNKDTHVGKQTIILPGSVVSGKLKEKCSYIGNPPRLLKY